MEKKAWTFLFFIAGDEVDIDPWSRLPLRKLEQVGSDADRWIIAHADFHWNESGTEAVAEPARRYQIEKFPGPMDGKDFSSLIIQSPVVWSSVGESDSTAGTALRDFLAWGTREYPADHFAVFILGHSWGWRGVGQDFSPGYFLPQLPEGPEIDSVMASLSEVSAALRGGMPTNRKVDLLVFDACNDGVAEVAYEMRDLARIFVAAPTEMPFLSFDYAKTFSRPMGDARDFARSLVIDMLPTFGRGGSQVTAEAEYPQLAITAVDLERLAPVWETWRALNDRFPSTNFADLFLGDRNADWLDAGWNIDWVEMLTEIAAQSDDPASRRLAEEMLGRLGEPAATPAFDAFWREYDTRGATRVEVQMRGDELHLAEKAKERAIEMFDYMNPHLKSVSKEWTTIGSAGRLDIKAAFPWAKESLSLRPFIAGGTSVSIRLLSQDQIMSEHSLEHPTGISLRTEFPAHSPYLVHGHTFGAGRNHGLSVSLDTTVDFAIAANHHYANGQWISGRDYYRTVSFSQAFGWADLLFSRPRTASVRPRYRNRNIRQK